MPAAITFRVNTTEFDRALRGYMEVTTRALPDVLNKKALYIARGALRLTPATQKGAITSSLGKIVRRRVGGQRVTTVTTVMARDHEAPLAALIINARRGRGGKPGLYGQEMADAVRELVAVRNRSRAFLKSGWIPAIRKLSPLVRESYGMAGRDGAAVQVGVPKGDATPARAGMQCRTIIENAASGTHETHDALVRYGMPALQQAFSNEARSMDRFVLDRLYEEARKIGIKAVVG